MVMGTLNAQSLLIRAHNWRMNPETGDDGILTVHDRFLEIAFKADLKQEFQFGNERVFQSVYTIATEKPVKLSAEQRRVYFSAKGITQPYSPALITS